MNLTSRLNRRHALALAAASIASSAIADASGYPNKPIKLIVAYAPGGGTDSLARKTGQVLSQRTAQSVLVENRPGGSTVVAAQALASAAPDGYTLAIFDPSTVAMNLALFKRLPYDPTKFEPVTTLVSMPIGLMVRPDFPATNIAQFVAYAKERPGMSFASSGAGNSIHLAMEAFRIRAGLSSMTHVPYKGASPALQDLLGGQVPVAMLDIASAIQYVNTGKLRVLGVASKERTELLPNTPTIAESGFPGFEGNSWLGVFAPEGTPPDIVAKLNSEFRTIMATPEISSWVKSMTYELFTSTPQAFSDLVRNDVRRYGDTIRKIGLTID